MTWLDILQPEIIHGRPRAIRTLRRSARLFYHTKDSLSNENQYGDPLSFLRKTTTISTLDKTDKDLLGPLLVRVFDLTNHLVICITLCRLKNYFLSYHVSHIYSIKLICQDWIGELAKMVERLLCMREVPVFFCLFLGTSL